MTDKTTYTTRRQAAAVLLVLTLQLITNPVSAHLMVAQHGTLNLVDNNAFMVLSLPVSAFTGLDSDGNGLVSMIEFNRSRASIIEEVRKHVVLHDAEGALALQGIMLSPSEARAAPNHLATQLIVMGKFVLKDSNLPLKFSITLFGSSTEEQSYKISASRTSSNQFSELIIRPEASVKGIQEAG